MTPSNLGPLTPFHPPSLAALGNYAVNREGQNEVIWQPTYDYQTYDTLGHSQLTFFQRTVGSDGTTLANTNMRGQGQFPAPQEFLIVGLQVVFIPGNVVAQANVGVATAQENWNDADDVMNGDAWLELFIGSKPYLQDGPLSKFTQQFRLGGVADQSMATPTTGAAGITFLDYVTHAGRYYAITPVRLPTTQNFNVSLNFPTLIPVSADAKIGVILDGFLYRLSQ